jgi:RNA polymerase sigma-70 factor (ECF subfamily)
MELKQQTSTTEEFWIEQASQGNLEAFNQLVYAYQDRAYQHALTMLGDEAEAEDVTQESFIKAFQALKSYRGGSFRGWLLRIVTNSAYDQLRRSSKRASQPLYPVDENGEEQDSPAWLADPNPSVQETVEQKEFSSDLSQMLNEIPDVYRNVLVLVDVQDFDYEEAAQALQVPIGTVKSRLARARHQMAKKLKQRIPAMACLAGAVSCLVV